MIDKLDNSNSEIAAQIFKVFQSSYKIEADLIGVKNFPPLSRTAQQIERSATTFYGFLDDVVNVVAVIEVNVEGSQLEIDSLTVAPTHFKKGIAAKLINHVLEVYEYSQAIVETAALNTPAINLYEKHGFIEFKRWTPSHGIKKLALRLTSTSN